MKKTNSKKESKSKITGVTKGFKKEAERALKQCEYWIKFFNTLKQKSKNK